jgi:hypothetical protein
MYSFTLRLGLGAIAIFAIAACGSNDEGVASSAAELTSDAGADETQVPPTSSSEAIDAWLAAGHYKRWACSPVRPARPPGGTAPNRICSNAVLSAHGDGEYPIGSTNVRELYDAAGTKIIGMAMTTKVAAGGGDAWYWFEHRDTGLVANGRGSSSTATRKCVGCHERANPDLFGHDLVFNQIR